MRTSGLGRSSRRLLELHARLAAPLALVFRREARRCMEDRGLHRGVALSRGRVHEGELQCADHGIRFDTAGDGTRMPCEGRDAKIPKGIVLTLPWVFTHGDTTLLEEKTDGMRRFADDVTAELA